MEEAPVIFIQPTAFGNQVTLVARNFKDFVALFINLKEVYVLERFRFYKNKLDFMNDYNDNYMEDIKMRESDYNLIIELLKENIKGITEIDDAYEYMIESQKQIELGINNDDFA